MEIEELIARLGERAHDPQRATDEGPAAGGKGKPAPRVAAPPATAAQAAAAEARLGFPLPALLRRLFLEVGNGGFGPGAGLLGLPGAGADEGEGVSAAGRYAALRRRKVAALWPSGLLPLCDWGHGILSCADCTRPEAPVVRVDPNMPKADEDARIPAAMRFGNAGLVKEACWVERGSLAEWLTLWAEGRSLFYLGYGAADEDGEDDEEDEEDGEDEEGE